VKNPFPASFRFSLHQLRAESKNTASHHGRKISSIGEPRVGEGEDAGEHT